MRIALVTTEYPPLCTSAAVQMRDLAQQLLSHGHEPVLLIPDETLERPWGVEVLNGVNVLRLAAPRTRGVGYIRRAFAEMLLPLAMLRNIRKSPFRRTRWNGVVWYSPPIFFGPLIWMLKRASRCRTYLILRDIFPEWARDLGILRRGPAYSFFKMAANFQYAVADSIGVQTPSNLAYLEPWASSSRRLEVLQNWLALVPDIGSSICIANTALVGRTIFVYVGNMGVAQGMDILIDLADSLKHREDIGFLFVGRGTEVVRLSAIAAARSLKNILFYNEVDSREMPGLLRQCHIGLLALDIRHKTHNIPGKFLTYLQGGLPVLARVNDGTDLARLIEMEGVGRVHVGESLEALRRFAEELADNPDERERIAVRGRALCARMFSPERAANQIVAAVSGTEFERHQ